MNKLIYLVLFVLFFGNVQAQDLTAVKTTAMKKERTLSLWGHIKDSFTKGGILGAKITLMRPDSSVVDTMTVKYFSGELNNIDTYYKFTIPAHEQKLIIKAEYPDYYPCYIDFQVRYVARNSYFDVPWHYMKKRQRKMEDVDHQLNEVVITATKVKIVYKGDTVVYNADAFNMAKGSMLDDLVKQMPGVQLKDNGEIYLNGEKADYLLLNGKDFFKGNNKVMLENLPYYTVNNVKFYDKSTHKSEALGSDVEKRDFVMDVNLKKEYSVGYMANGEVAGGTEDRYLTRLFGLRFTNSTRFSLYGNMNNVNEDRKPGREGDWEPSNDTGGETETKKARIDFSYEEKEQKYNDNFSASVTWQRYKYNSSSLSETFLSNGSNYSRSESSNKYSTLNFTISNQFYINKAPFYLRNYSLLSHTERHNNSFNRLVLFDADPQEYGDIHTILDSIFQTNPPSSLTDIGVNKQRTYSLSDGTRTSFQNYLTMTKRLKWGDDIEFNVLLDGSNYHNTSYSLYQLSYIQSSLSDDNRNSYTLEKSNEYYCDAYLKYSFNLLNNWGFGAMYKYDQGYLTSNSTLYRLDWLNSWEDDLQHSLGELPSTQDSLLLALDAANSPQKTYLYKIHSGRGFLFYRENKNGKNIQFNVSIPVNNRFARTHYIRNAIDTTLHEHNIYFEPFVELYYNTNNYKQQLRFTYNTWVTFPDVEKKLDIRDDSNPLAIQLGNPDLKNTINHQWTFYISKSIPEKQRLLYCDVYGNIVQRKQANGFTYDSETGVYTYKPENVNGNWNTGIRLGYSSAIDKSKHWTWETNTYWSYLRNVDLTAVSGSTQSSLSKVNNYVTEQQLKLSYQFSKVKFGLNGKFNWNNATSSRENFETINTYDFNYGMTGEYQMPKNFTFVTDLKMFSRRCYDNSAINSDKVVWNASLQHPFLKGEIIARLEGFDLLHNLTNVYYSVNGQGLSESIYNTIPPYIMFHMGFRLSYSPKNRNENEMK